jgi:acyl-CoA thioester hydrolase
MTTTLADDNDLLLQPVPFLSSVMQIEPQWIDYNGHLNMAYYNVMFDRAIDELWLKLGIGPGYMKERHGSTFTAECHVRYLREIYLGDPAQVSILLVAADEKRLHTFEELRHATEGWLSATSENMTTHRHECAQDRAISTRHPGPHRGGDEGPRVSRTPRGHRQEDCDALEIASWR